MEVSDCRIVLVSPRDPNNIGAAARAMKNFGFRDLAVVLPHAPVWEEAVSAVNAEDVLSNARVFPDLATAIADRTIVAGTADRRRTGSGTPICDVADLQSIAAPEVHKVALVFGSEKTGLSNRDLEHCHWQVSIPTDPNCPSMNLGQAVAVCCYELSRGRNVITPQFDREPRASAGEIEAGVTLAREVMRDSGFLPDGNDANVAARLRRSLLRFNLSHGEISILCGFLRKVRDRPRDGET